MISGLIWQKFELIQASMSVVFTGKSEKDWVKKHPKKDGEALFTL